MLRLALEEGIKPALIIGIPVGFVGAAESKDYLMEVSPVPYITVSQKVVAQLSSIQYVMHCFTQT